MEVKITVGRWDESVRLVYVENGIGDVARVLQDHDLDGNVTEPTVQWWSMGARSPQDAESASSSIAIAARVAREMAQVKVWGRITPPLPGYTYTGDGRPEIHFDGDCAYVGKDGWIEDAS